ncbi:unnamed protein product [Rotaria sordida]|uniref:Uncharacterized protein n=1 Tax=Rotaria sordida TaxID=392033 RepID=A0A814ELD0_9BILA|nr:unnamed protein product [Rotaria sordida]CAF0853909.1 unnamed protein product [Rotaria sordida]CAF0967827.1 unnamed protein product [Rotaria sordida]
MGFFEPCSAMPAWRAWLIAISTVFVAFVSSIIFNQTYYQILSLALQMRLAYTGIVFRKEEQDNHDDDDDYSSCSTDDADD